MDKNNCTTSGFDFAGNQPEKHGYIKGNCTLLGIDPGLAHTGWGIVQQQGNNLSCVAYGCITTQAKSSLEQRIEKIYSQMNAVIERFNPCACGIETIWFGQNVSAAFATGQARGAVLVACAQHKLELFEFTPRQIKLSVVGTGTAEKAQVQYMVKNLLSLEASPKPDHASDALAAAICVILHNNRHMHNNRHNKKKA